MPDGEKTLDEKLKEFEEKFDAKFTKVAESLEAVSGTILSLNEKISARPADNGDDKAKNKPTDISERDLEQMSRPQFMQHMMGQFKGILEETIKPISSQVETETITRKQRDVAGQIETAAGKYKDFWDWKEDMGRLAKVHPTLPVDDLYHLARQKSPDRTKELDEKYNPPEPEKKPAEGFGGLFPNSGNLSSEELEKDMTSDEAANLAWEKTMAGMAPSE